ncbi:MAG: recombinase RecA [Oscillospiraceae bacterium]|nr:recombinase RecA [Oscillospiraceae bacterium]
MADKNKLGKNLTVERKLEAEERKKAVVSVMSAIEKQYGKGSIMKMGERSTLNVEAIPTGVLTLDVALGIGGIPRGRVIEIYGPESSGKTTVALNIIAQAQKAGGEAAFIDAEHALDPVYAAKLGVDVDNLLISQPDTGEQALDIAEALVRCGAIDVIVVDSVAALVPKAEIEGTMGDAHVGLLARLMSQALRKLTAITNRSGTAVIFINQLREKVGISYGNPETTTGGRALKFFSSVRIEVRKSEVLKNGTEVVGVRTKTKIVKNKVAPPFREAEFDIIYGEGISKEGNILDVAIDLDVIQKSGSWFSYNGEKLGQGRDNIRRYMAENPEFTAEIDSKVRELLRDADMSFAGKKDAAETPAPGGADGTPGNAAADDIVEVTENSLNTFGE